MADSNKCKKLYTKCIDEGIKKLESRAEIARMVLTAKNNGISGTEEELTEMFNEGKVIVERTKAENRAAEAERKARERLDNIRKAEMEDVAYIKKIASFLGVEKPIYFLKEEISISKELKDDYRKEREDALKLGVSLYQAGKMKEKDWAIRGGIASGLAGGAAGLATALDAQQHNAQAREYNKELMSSVAGMMSPLTPSVQREADMDKDIQHLREKIEKYRKKLVEYLSPMELLIRLSPKVKEQRVTETGAIRLTVETKAAHNVAIYDEVKAVIDGSFKALLLDNEEVVGEAIFVLPFGGAFESEELDSICVDINNTEKKIYDVVFVPNKLWAIETRGTVKNKEQDLSLSEENKRSIIYYAWDILRSGHINSKEYEQLLSLLDNINDKKFLADFKAKIKIIEKKVEQEKVEKQKNAKRKVKLYSIIGVAVVAIIAMFALIHTFVIEPDKRYKMAIQLIQDGEHVEAIEVFSGLDGYRDSDEKIVFAKEEMYAKATNAFAQGDYDTAISMLLFLGKFKDSDSKIIEIKDEMYNNATELLEQKKYEESFLLFRKIYAYKDSSKYIKRFDISYDSMEHIKSPNTEYRGMYESIKNIYDDSGYLIERKRIWDSGDYTSVTKYTNNSSGFCVREDVTTTTDDGYSFPSTKHYDNNGKCIKSISTIGDETSVYNYRYEYIYDGNNRCIKEICNHDDGKSETYEYTYDSNGNCVKEVYTSAHGNNYNYTIVRTYNEKGILEQEVYEKRGVKNISKYNEFGDCIYFEHDYVDDDESYKEERIYNQFGDCIKTVETNNNGKVITTEYLYDEYGRQLKYGGNLKKSADIDGEYTYSGLRITFK